MNDDSVNNTLYDTKAVEKEEIPAEAFTEAPESLVALLAAGADAGGGAAAAGCSAAASSATGCAGGGDTWGAREELKGLDEENWMPPYRPPARPDMSRADS